MRFLATYTGHRRLVRLRFWRKTMTGRGHRWTGVGAALLAAAIARLLDLPELIAAAVAATSTTMPDWIEIPVYRNGVRKGSLITHRTLTHWPPLWLGLMAWGAHEGGIAGAMMLGAATGSMIHILGDAPNPMGIPWLWPTDRIRFGKKGWWRSGEHEPFLALVFATFGFVAWSLAGGRVS